MSLPLSLSLSLSDESCCGPAVPLPAAQCVPSAAPACRLAHALRLSAAHASAHAPPLPPPPPQGLVHIVNSSLEEAEWKYLAASRAKAHGAAAKSPATAAPAKSPAGTPARSPARTPSKSPAGTPSKATVTIEAVAA